MFAHKARVTAFVCVLIILLNVAFFYAPLAGSVRTYVLLALVLAAIIPGIYRKSITCSLTCLAITASAYFYFSHWQSDRDTYSLLRLANKPVPEVSFVGTVCDTIVSAAAKRKHIVVDVGAFNYPFNSLCRGRLLLDVSPTISAERGDLLVARGYIDRVEPPIYPWDYSILPLLRKTGSTAQFHAVSVSVIPVKKDCDDFIAVIDHIRAHIIKTHVDAIGATQGNLLTSMVIGNRNVEVDDSISTAFRNLGISHTLAASGFNLSVVVGSTWWLLRPLIRNRPLLNLTAFLLMAFYSALAGLSASIVRAALMCTGLLLASAFHRQTEAIVSLGTTLVLTLFLDPMSLSDVGLQLSYISTATLMSQSVNTINILSNFKPHRILRKLIEVAAPCALAVCAVFPLQLYYFWQSGILQLPTNILISPLVPLITVEGFISSALACLHLPLIAMLMDRVAGLLVLLLLLIVNHLNSYQWTVLNTGPPQLDAMYLYYFSLALLLSARAFRARAIIAAVGVFSGAVALLWRPNMPPLTVIKMNHATVAIDGGRRAILVGDANRFQVRRCLAYFATNATTTTTTTTTGATPYVEWSKLPGNRVTIRIRRSGRSVILRAGAHSQTSEVREYN
jgi:competence protein ComEC